MKHTQTCAVIALATLLAACGGGDKEAKAKKAAHHEDKPAAAASAPVAAQPAAPAVQPEHHQACRATTDDEIAALFDRWNNALKTGKPANVVANYARDSILLPTVSDKVRYSPAEKEDYFVHFLEKAPVGQINERYIQIGCNTALDAGIYTFTYQKTGEQATGRYSYTYKWDGNQWLITSHHSSVLPEKLLAAAAAAKAAPQAPAAPQAAAASAAHH